MLRSPSLCPTWTSVTLAERVQWEWGHLPNPHHRGPPITPRTPGASSPSAVGRRGGDGSTRRHPGLLASLGRDPELTPRDGAEDGRKDPSGIAPLARDPTVGVSPHGSCDDWRPGDRARFQFSPRRSLTCAHAGSSRSSPAPALRPEARARASRRPAAGAQGGGRGRSGARRPGSAAAARAEHAWEDSAVGL